jgi:putative hemolysin
MVSIFTLFLLVFFSLAVLFLIYRTGIFDGSGIFPSKYKTTLSDEKLRALLNLKNENHDRMLERLLEFSQRQVRDVMVPRLEVTSIDINTPFEDMLHVVESTRYSRFPIYQGVLDNVVGILHAKDLMPYLHHPKTFRLSQLLRKPMFVPIQPG